MAGSLTDALKQLTETAKQRTDALQSIERLDPKLTRHLQAAKQAGASEAELVAASGLSRVTVWKRLKA